MKNKNQIRKSVSGIGLVIILILIAFIFQLEVNAQPKIPSTEKIGKALKSKVLANDTVKKATKILITPSKITLNKNLNLKKSPQGILKKIIQPIRFKDNRNTREKERMYLFMMELIHKGQLKMDSQTVDEIMVQLDTINSANKLNDKSNEETEIIIDCLVESNDMYKKASKAVVDSIKTQMSAVLLASTINNDKDERNLSVDINKVLKEIKKVQYSCASKLATKIDSITKNDTLKFIKRCLNPKIKVFGWHQSGKGDQYKYYNYNYLSVINLDNYNLSPGGKCSNPEALKEFEKTGGIIKLAQSKGCTIHLTIYNNNATEISSFLRNNSARKTFFTELDTLIKRNNLKGINIFFDNTMKPEPFVRFIKELRQNIKGIDPSIQLNISLPAITGDNYKSVIASYDFQNLIELVDYYMVLTENMLPQNPTFAQSASPLYSIEKYGNRSIESTIGFYNNIGIPTDQLIMTVSYSGFDWQVYDFTGFLSIPDADQLTYNEILEKIKNRTDDGHTIVEGFDSDQVSAFFNITGVDSEENEQIWFEDFRSLYLKYNWALENDLGGVSIRGLGDDEGYSELWDALGASLIKIETSYIAQPAAEMSRFRKFWNIFSNTVKGFKFITFRQDMKWAKAVRLKFDDNSKVESYTRFNRDTFHINDSIPKYIGKQIIWDMAVPCIKDPKRNNEPFLPDLMHGYSLYARWTIYGAFFRWCSILLLFLTVLFSYLSYNSDRYILGSDKTRSLFRNMPAIFISLTLFASSFWLYFDPSFESIGAGSDDGANSLLMIYVLFAGIVVGWIGASRYYIFKRH